MCCGVEGKDLVVRISPGDLEAALSLPHARPMDFTGRPIRGFVYVGPEGCTTDQKWNDWIQRGLDFVLRLPPK